MTVYPEVAVASRSELPLRRWRVDVGGARRGEASCDLGRAVIEVPLGAGEAERVVRAHELMHARVSPARPVVVEAVSTRALECAEEYRVNLLLARQGFPVGALCDGSERAGGRQLGEHGAFADALFFALAVAGTGAERPFLAGLRAAKVPWVGAVKALVVRAAEMAKEWSTELLADTAEVPGGPRGYLATTIPLARLVSLAAGARPPRDAAETRRFRAALRPGGRRPPSGRFAEVVVGSWDLDVAPVRPVSRRRRPAATGTVMSRPGRLLTDPQRRAFTRAGRGPGGIVVVDLSGSMDPDPEALTAMVHSAPGCLVVAYSHRPGDLGGAPNLWVVADRGRVATGWPSGQVGNGVDGPALEWALARRRAGEPVLWVTDGQVTDSNDHPDPDLTDRCAQLVLKHRITLIRTVEEVPRALRRSPGVGESRTWTFGRVGRRLAAIQGM